MITPGARRLGEFLEKHRIKKRVAADAIGIAHPSLIAWLRGASRPSDAHKRAIEVWTGGAIPFTSWFSPSELRVRDRIEHIAPYRPELPRT